MISWFYVFQFYLLASATFFVFDETARSRGTLTFVTRLHIALCSAKGVLYLHTEAYPPIIHRDIKANNILLDSKFNAKVSDFGISCLVPVSDGEEVATAHVSTVVRGTPVSFTLIALMKDV